MVAGPLAMEYCLSTLRPTLGPVGHLTRSHDGGAYRAARGVRRARRSNCGMRRAVFCVMSTIAERYRGRLRGAESTRRRCHGDPNCCFRQSSWFRIGEGEA